MQIIQNRFIGFGDGFFDVIYFQRPDRFCGSFPSALKLAWLVKKVHNLGGGEPLFARANRSVLGSRGFGINSFLFDGRSRFLSDQPCNFAVQSRDHCSNPNDPFGRSLALRKQHFDSLLVPE